MTRLTGRRTLAKTAPTLLILVLLAALAFAATASAEVRVGEATAPVNPKSVPELNILQGSASYDTAAGSVVFHVTTAAEPQRENEQGEPSQAATVALLGTVSSACSIGALESLGSLPMIEMLSLNSSSFPGFVFLNTPLEESVGIGEKSVAGTLTTLAATSPRLVGQGFNCAAVATESGGSREDLVFPISAPPPPPPPPVPAPVVPPTPAPAPQPAPAALSIAKAKPLKLKVGQSKTVKIKVTNTGATTMAVGSLRVKAPAGVLVKPEKQQIPVLTPGASWTLPVRLKLKPSAKVKSTISLTGTAPGLSAKSSFVVKLLG